MTRSVREIMNRDIEAVAHLRPQGDHWIELRCAGAAMILTIDQLPRVERAIAAFREEVRFEDGRGSERTFPHAARLGRF